ncbi:CidA/LrgA family protein [Geomonas sp. Red32]|nr:CidA/LrgA family protein [Geomonas sp. Red32]
MFQLLLISGFWVAGEAIVRVTGLPVPGAIVGMLIVLALLSTGKLSLHTVQRGARWFLAEMLLFFVPAVLAVLDHPEFLGMLGLKILAVIVFSTVMVMVVTAAVIDVCYRWDVARKGVGHAE